MEKIIKNLENKIQDYFNSGYFSDAIKKSELLLQVDPQNIIGIEYLKKAEKEKLKKESSETNEVRDIAIRNLEEHISKIFENGRFHEAIKFSLVLLEIDKKNILGKDLLKKSKRKLEELTWLQGNIYWFTSYNNSFSSMGINNDPYQNTIYKTYEDGYNNLKEKIKKSIYSIILVIVFTIAYIYIFEL